MGRRNERSTMDAQSRNKRGRIYLARYIYPRTKNKEPRTKNQERITKNQEPRTQNQDLPFHGVLHIGIPWRTPLPFYMSCFINSPVLKSIERKDLAPGGMESPVRFGSVRFWSGLVPVPAVRFYKNSFLFNKKTGCFF